MVTQNLRSKGLRLHDSGIARHATKPTSILGEPCLCQSDIKYTKVAKMCLSYFTKSIRFRFLFILLFNFLLVLIGAAAQAAPENNNSLAWGVDVDFPQKFGEIVYQTNADASSQIYIIANGHRSAIRGVNAAHTVQAQVETFRIGEWLINQNRIELLLPEGFFGKMEEPTTGGDTISNLLDGKVLQDALEDTSLFVNAELLLHQNYGIFLDQIEDRSLYLYTREHLRSNLESEGRLSNVVKRDLVYLQKLRTASILQSVPAVIETAYQQGRISSPNAMLTIGLSHLDDIIHFLEVGEISIDALHTITRDFPAMESELELLKKQFGVTVIVPRTLVEQRHWISKNRI